MPERSGARTGELDVRQVPKPQRHPLIFDRFAALPPAGSFVLVNSHDPKHLRQEFDRDHPGTYTWDYLETGPAVWRIRITKRTSADLPRVVGKTTAMTSARHPTQREPSGRWTSANGTWTPTSSTSSPTDGSRHTPGPTWTSSCTSSPERAGSRPRPTG
jgi:uncharacterized protein (DUF2249 family)